MKRIPFKAELARAIREGRKTETRRLMNPRPPDREHPAANPFKWCRVETVGPWFHIMSDDPLGMFTAQPKYRVGEIVGIAEPWFMQNSLDAYSGTELIKNGWRSPMFYADYQSEADLPLLRGRYRQARFLPDAFVRTKLRITAVEAQRLQEITNEQAIFEGIEMRVPTKEDLDWCEAEYGSRDMHGVWIAPGTDVGYGPPNHREIWAPTAYGAFTALWDSIHGKEAPWNSNPWVWRYQFEVEKSRS